MWAWCAFFQAEEWFRRCAVYDAHTLATVYWQGADGRIAFGRLPGGRLSAPALRTVSGAIGGCTRPRPRRRRSRRTLQRRPPQPPRPVHILAFHADGLVAHSAECRFVQPRTIRSTNDERRTHRRRSCAALHVLDGSLVLCGRCRPPTAHCQKSSVCLRLFIFPLTCCTARSGCGQ